MTRWFKVLENSYFIIPNKALPLTVFRIRIILMRIRDPLFPLMRLRNQLFTLMQIRILLFTLIRMRITSWILFLIKAMRIGDQFKPLRLNCERQRPFLSLHCCRVLNLMRFRILLLTLMRNRILLTKMMRIRIGTTFLRGFFLTCKKNMGSSREEEVVVVSSRSSSSSAPASEGSGFTSRPRTLKSF